MKTLSFLISVATLATLASCTVDNTKNPTASSESKSTVEKTVAPSPTVATSDMKLENIDTAIFDFEAVKDENFKYLDSLNLEYKEENFADLVGDYDKTIVYFYPKDGTPNCTIQALDFSLMQEKLNKMGYGVLWVSQDDLDSHKLFAERNELKIPLIHDNSGSLLDAFGSRMAPQTYGNGDELSDINRSTYVVDSNGKLLYAFRDVEAKGHARAVYKLLTNLDY